MARNIKLDVERKGKAGTVEFFKDKFKRELEYYESSTFSLLKDKDSSTRSETIKQINPQLIQRYRMKVTEIKNKHDEFICALNGIKTGMMKLFSNTDEDYKRLDAMYAEIDKLDSEMNAGIMGDIHNDIVRLSSIWARK